MLIESILTYLTDNGLIKKNQLKDLSLKAQSDVVLLEEELVKAGLVRSEDFLKAKSFILKTPYLDLTDKTIPPDVLKEIPEDAALHYLFLPIEKKGEELTVGMVNPEDVEAQEALKFIALKGNFIPKTFLISKSNFDVISKQYRTLGKEVGQALEELEQDLSQEQLAAEELGAEKVEQLAADAPVTKMVAVILKHAVDGRASDIHIEPLEDKTRVRFRQDGNLHSSLFLPKTIHNAVVARIKVLSNLKIDETRMPQDGRFHTKVDNKKVDFRVSSLPTAYGEKIALRILDPTIGVGNFQELGFIGRNLEIYEKSIKSPYGVVLITGPTGSGKSTTLYTTLNYINKEGVNIITLEDPVEYYIEGVNQSQIKPEISYTFASGLRSILRQDPNIIMVGEIRDKETASLAIHAALTGHLVFSTLHTNSALGIIPRLIDMGIDQFLIPSTLVAGLAQRLIKRLCPDCAKPMDIPENFNKVISESLTGVPEDELKKYGPKKPFKLYKAEGCPACGQKGTKGRLAIYEIFKMTPEMEKVTLEPNPSDIKIGEVAQKQGMISMKQDGIMKALAGLVSIEEVLKVVEE